MIDWHAIKRDIEIKFMIARSSKQSQAFWIGLSVYIKD